jgi:hypothetical protein
MGSLVEIVKVAMFFKIHLPWMMGNLCRGASVFGVY